MFMGYIPLHKGVRCLDISTRCIYISHDVFLREHFPFVSLNPNVGPRLWQEIILFSKPSPSPSYTSGDAQMNDLYVAMDTNFY
jgi:hypothetical protein